MKTYLFIPFCFFSISFVNSQSTFEYLYSSPYNEISKSLIEDNQGSIYFAAKNFHHALLIKLDFQGSFLDSISIYNPGGTCNLEELIRIDENHFVALGDWTSDSVSELWYVKFDNNFQIIDDKKLSSNNWYITEFHYIITKNKNIVFTAQYLTLQPKVDVCMYEITKDGDLVRNMFFNTTSTFNIASSLLENSYDRSYKIFSTGSLSPPSSKMPVFINVVDTNFNLLENFIIHYPNINTNTTAKWINDSTYLLAGKWLVYTEGEWDLGILKVTKDDSVLLSASFGKPDTVDWSANYECLDFTSNDNIFFAGTSNSYYPFQNEPSWIMLNILDSDLNLKNQRFYGGDAFYLVNAILATQDGGCMLSCSRYDYLTQNEEYDIFILKVNQEGLLVSTPENPIINVNPCYIYPNPGSELLNINSPLDQIQIQLFNLTGIMECESDLSVGTNSISVSNLHSGIYLYRIFDQNYRIIQSGKWIKM